jgi:hypothetical protein
MNEMLELWSLPWHALQRSLAEAFGVEAPAASATGPAAAALRTEPGVSPSAEPLSWLARAHLQLRQTVS